MTIHYIILNQGDTLKKIFEVEQRWFPWEERRVRPKRIWFVRTQRMRRQEEVLDSVKG